MEGSRELMAATTGPLPQADAVAFFTALTLVLAFARVLGEAAKKLGQPMVMGELIAGILLGKTCLAQINPAAFAYLFQGAKSASAFAGVTNFCVTLYMTMAGLELNLQLVLKRKGATVAVGLLCLIVPFGLGMMAAVLNPALFGAPPGVDTTNYAFFVGIAMAITALPVAAKTLRDLNLYKTEMGRIVISAAVVDDVLGWTLFAVCLSISVGQANSTFGLGGGIAVSISYVILMLTLGSFVFDRALPYVQAYFSFPGGELGFYMFVALGSATFALWIGLHNTLGAFLAGAAIGNSRHVRPAMRETLDNVVTYMMAPIFFGSVCLNANFVSDFNAGVVFMVFFLSCVGKLLGGFLGAKLSKSSIRDAAAIAVCMNARGAMELILATVAMDAKIIDGKMFVALVFMAIVTSLLPGPLLRRILRRAPVASIVPFIPRSGGFAPKLASLALQDAIRELCQSMGQASVADILITKATRHPSVVNHGVCVVHCQHLTAVNRPIVAIGLSEKGMIVPNRVPAKVLVVLVLPDGADTVEADLLREIDNVFSNLSFLDELTRARSYVELRALLLVFKFRVGEESYEMANQLAKKDLSAIASNSSSNLGTPLLLGDDDHASEKEAHPSKPIPRSPPQPLMGGSRHKSSSSGGGSPRTPPGPASFILPTPQYPVNDGGDDVEAQRTDVAAGGGGDLAEQEQDPKGKTNLTLS